jgi:pre-mRNA-splicing factor CDC5/CEF1
LIKDEAEYLRVAMGHENDSLDEFVEAHTTCVNDLMFFVTRNEYALSSVAGNMEKLAALQNEFENVRIKLDAGKEKLIRLEKKVTVLTQGYEVCYYYLVCKLACISFVEILECLSCLNAL